MRNIITLLALAFIIGCTPQKETEKHTILRDYIGKEVTIQFKRNELGLAEKTMLSPTSTGLNSSTAALKGVLKDISDDGVLISGSYIVNPGKHGRLIKYESWVPFDSILHIVTLNQMMEEAGTKL